MPSNETENAGRIIVVGYDGSPTSRAAVEHAAQQAGRRGTVHLVHSYGLPAEWLGFPNYDLVLDEHRARGEAMLDAIATGDDPLLATHFETELVETSSADAIIDVADSSGADEIVIGSRGLGRVRSVLGSVSHDVLHRATVPVVVIPFVAGAALT
jgi:nucleotide-binding universal stress UspA family protein